MPSEDSRVWFPRINDCKWTPNHLISLSLIFHFPCHVFWNYVYFNRFSALKRSGKLINLKYRGSRKWDFPKYSEKGWKLQAELMVKGENILVDCWRGLFASICDKLCLNLKKEFLLPPETIFVWLRLGIIFPLKSIERREGLNKRGNWLLCLNWPLRQSSQYHFEINGSANTVRSPIWISIRPAKYISTFDRLIMIRY